MLLGKFFITTFTLAAMAITHVASAPTAQPDAVALEKRGGVSERMDQCYSDVQTKCKDIENTMSHHNNVIDVTVAAEIKVELQAIVDILVKVCADIEVAIKAGVSATDIQGCGKTFILIVKLLVSILVKILAACQSGAIAILAVVVVKLKVQIELCASLIIGCIDGLVGLLLGLVLELLLSLKVDINACVSVFVDICNKY